MSNEQDKPTDATFLLNSVAEILYGLWALPPDAEVDRNVVRVTWEEFTAWVREISRPSSIDLARYLIAQGVDLEAIGQLPLATAHYISIVVRIDGEDKEYEADWLKRLAGLKVELPTLPQNNVKRISLTYRDGNYYCSDSGEQDGEYVAEQMTAWAEANGYVKRGKRRRAAYVPPPADTEENAI